jgi:hypothetical protein
LPLLQGIDPNTGLKVGVAGTLAPPPNYEAIGVDYLPDTVGQDAGGPFGNGMIGGMTMGVQMQGQAEEFGRNRQQEALERNAMLRAQGRHR